MICTGVSKLIHFIVTTFCDAIKSNVISLTLASCLQSELHLLISDNAPSHSFFRLFFLFWTGWVVNIKAELVAI